LTELGKRPMNNLSAIAVKALQKWMAQSKVFSIEQHYRSNSRLP